MGAVKGQGAWEGEGGATVVLYCAHNPFSLLHKQLLHIPVIVTPPLTMFPVNPSSLSHSPLYPSFSPLAKV